MGLKTIVFYNSDHEWERCNKDHLLRHSMETEATSIDAIPELLRAGLRIREVTDYEPIAAESRIPSLVDQAIADFRALHIHRSLTRRTGKSLEIEAEEASTEELHLTRDDETIATHALEKEIR